MKVVVWQGDGEAIASVRYGDRIAAAVRSWGHDVEVVDHADAIWPVEADVIVLTGGSTSVHEVSGWMPQALQRTREVVEAAKTGRVRVVGICLGAQMIATALGANIVERDSLAIGCVPSSSGHLRPVFHYHQIDGSSLDADILETTPGTPVARFRHSEHIEAVQYHPELHHDDVIRLVLENVEMIETFGGDVESALHSVMPYRYDETTLAALIAG